MSKNQKPEQTPTEEAQAATAEHKAAEIAAEQQAAAEKAKLDAEATEQAEKEQAAKKAEVQAAADKAKLDAEAAEQAAKEAEQSKKPRRNKHCRKQLMPLRQSTLSSCVSFLRIRLSMRLVTMSAILMLRGWIAL